MRAPLLLAAVSVSLSMTVTGCRTPTAITVHVLSDVPCDKQRGVIVAAGAPEEYESLPPAGRSSRCSPLGNGLYDLGTLVVVPRKDREARIGIRAVLGARRDAEACSSADQWAGCIVARRLLHYLPNDELTVDILLRQDCADVACDARTTCVDRTCGGAQIDPGACLSGCGEGALPAARTCDTPGEVACEGGLRLTCMPGGVLRSEDCGIACTTTSCVGATAVVAMAAAGQKGTTCALVDGAVYCWGDNAAGRLGTPTAPPATTPTKVAGLPRIVQLASMGTASHVVALDDTGGVWCWGTNDSRQCGLPVSGPVAVRSVEKRGGGAWVDVVQVVASSNSTCVRRSNGVVECFGGGSVGQLGRGDTSPDDRPSPVLVAGAWSGVARDVACATNACCVLDDKGAVACFGNNSSGQIGVGSTETRIPTPSAVKLPAEARAIRAGDNAFCAMLVDDRVACWGDGDWNLLLADKLLERTPVVVEALSGKGVRDLAIAFPTGHYATTAAGTVGGTTWGWGTSGLGKSPLAPVASLAGARTVSLAFQHACALVAGQVLCFGTDANGALGDGTLTPHAAPAPVKWPF
ncbi:MAG: hypothetical protein HYV09_02250 [Deltaproteobacteria bacterium]|nr:hypothetical protein [Deltaproteobacteria bacterium]